MQDKLQSLSQSCERYHYNLFGIRNVFFLEAVFPPSLFEAWPNAWPLPWLRRAGGADEQKVEGSMSREKGADAPCAVCLAGSSDSSHSLVWLLHPGLDACSTALTSACNFSL